MMVTIFKGIENFTNFVLAFLRGGGSLVSQEKANERAAVCSQCHNNVNVDQAVKVGCCGRGLSNIMNSFSKQILQSRSTPSDGKLRSCALCGCFLRIKVWVPPEALGIKPEDSNAYPEFCWIKKELQ